MVEQLGVANTDEIEPERVRVIPSIKLAKELFTKSEQFHKYSHTGGCGSMYEITIDSRQFEGKRVIQQHRMVNEVNSNTQSASDPSVACRL